MSAAMSLRQHPVATPIVVYDHAVPASGRNRSFIPAFHTFWWVREGWAEITGPFGSLRIPPQRGIFLSPGVHRRQAFAPSTVLLSLSFVLTWEDGQPLLASRPPVPYRPGGTEDLIASAEAVCAAKGDEAVSPERWLAFQGTFQSFLAVVLRWAAREGIALLEPASCDPRLARVVEEIQRQPSAGPLPFSEWERRAGLGRSHLNRLAREQLGESLHAHRNRILADALRKTLLTTHASTKELAASFGFVDSAHLCHWLRRHTGCSPAELRQHPV